MRRRELLKLLGFVSGSGVLTPLAGCGGGGGGSSEPVQIPSMQPAVATAPPPNVVVIVADDLRYDGLSVNGNMILSTPNIDSLTNQGSNFINSFVTTSICPVSRVSILTGQHMKRHGIQDFRTQIGAAAFENSFPAILRSNGWHTGFLGKWGIGEDIPTDFYDEFDGFAGQGSYFPEGLDRPHLTAEIGRAASEFVERNRNSPFLLSLSFKAPHAEGSGNPLFLPDPRFTDLYESEEIPVPLAATSESFDQLPQFIRESEGRNRWMQRFATDAEFQSNVKDYYRLIAGMDAAIGELLLKLQQLDLYDNTIILFTSDNGFFLGEHGLAGKWLMYEESIRIPLIIKPAANESDVSRSVIDQMALNIDIAPTLLDMVGLSAPDAMQGSSLLSLMRDAQADWREDWYYEHRFEFDGQIPVVEGVRSSDWKYVDYPNHDYHELYDLINDPWETQNLAADSNFAAIATDMSDRLDELRLQSS